MLTNLPRSRSPAPRDLDLDRAHRTGYFYARSRSHVPGRRVSFPVIQVSPAPYFGSPRLAHRHYMICRHGPTHADRAGTVAPIRSEFGRRNLRVHSTHRRWMSRQPRRFTSASRRGPTCSSYFPPGGRNCQRTVTIKRCPRCCTQ